jgi:hypothetical protein
MEKTKELKKEKKKKKKKKRRGRKSYRRLKWAEAAVEKRERKIGVESSSGARWRARAATRATGGAPGREESKREMRKGEREIVCLSLFHFEISIH